MWLNKNTSEEKKENTNTKKDQGITLLILFSNDT